MNDSNYQRVRLMMQDGLRATSIGSTLEKLLDEMVERVDADPELRRSVIRETLRSHLTFSSAWPNL
jgi:hypothetical protein